MLSSTARASAAKKLTRIVGGNNTLVNEFPWQAALYIAATKKFMCGGSLITNQHILTAAHCFEISANLLPVCLPSSAKSKYANVSAVVTGCGASTFHGPTISTLQKVQVPVLSRKDCMNKTGYSAAQIQITRKMLCAGAAGLDSCQGNSGGPLVYLDNTQSYSQVR
ncbi:hypothetical protein HAZT_HAZT011754 [Hyalella azteca]|uniref:Peptidase S1 domain-containing protein n=1 Tax=Hyalella azteca TaxID=294128 RepID=A0A6A0GX05_HYAAZ|nr:hypothetical protein HAZT_HAZT011754 [Hyalella azteca]